MQGDGPSSGLRHVPEAAVDRKVGNLGDLCSAAAVCLVTVSFSRNKGYSMEVMSPPMLLIFGICRIFYITRLQRHILGVSILL